MSDLQLIEEKLTACQTGSTKKLFFRATSKLKRNI